MNYAIILSGGVGQRLGADIPKQYLSVKNKPIIIYSIEKFCRNTQIDTVVIVAAKQWQPEICGWAKVADVPQKYVFAESGKTRQESVYNGLKACATCSDEDLVIIHDAARPLVSEKLIAACLKELSHCEAVMPVLPMRDTVYKSIDGKTVAGLLNRDSLFAGQTPEGFRLKRYIALHDQCTEDEIASFRGSSEIAVRGGLEVHLIAGEINNFKITVQEDLKKFSEIIGDDQ